MIINKKQLPADVQYAANRVPVLDDKVAALEEEVVSILHYKGVVETYADLPSSGNKIGDVWNIRQADPEHEVDAGDNAAWNGESWDILGGTTDLSEYLRIDDAEATYVPLNSKNTANGVAGLDENNKVLADKLPIDNDTLVNDNGTVKAINQSGIKYYHAEQYIADPEILDNTPFPVIDDLTEAGTYNVDFAYSFDQGQVDTQFNYYISVLPLSQSGTELGIYQSLYGGVSGQWVIAYRAGIPDGQGGYTWTNWDGMVVPSEINKLTRNKQDKLTAGPGITLDGSTISSSIMQCQWFTVSQSSYALNIDPLNLNSKNYVRVSKNGQLLQPKDNTNNNDYFIMGSGSAISFTVELVAGDKISVEYM